MTDRELLAALGYPEVAKATGQTYSVVWNWGLPDRKIPDRTGICLAIGRLAYTKGIEVDPERFPYVPEAAE